MKLLFEGGEVDFDGRYYQLEGLEAHAAARPAAAAADHARRRPGRRMLTLAAREADILNFPDRPSRRGEHRRQRRRWGSRCTSRWRSCGSTPGPRYAALELSALVFRASPTTMSGVIATLATQMQTTPEVVEAMPGTLVGSREAIVDKLRANREQWDMSYPVIPGGAIDSMAPIVAELAGT